MKCECGCGSKAQVVHTELLGDNRYILCRNCELLFVTNSLTPEMFNSMLKNGHKTSEFMLHSDFYDKFTGEALQPKLE